jgi:hypothetical protein
MVLSLSLGCERLGALLSAPATDGGAPSTPDGDRAVAGAEDSGALAPERDASSRPSEDAAEAPERAPDADAPPPGVSLTAIGRVNLHEAPQARSRALGYVRAGAVLRSLQGPVGNDGCALRREVPLAGWHQVDGGFVCVGGAVLPTAEVSARRSLYERRLLVPPDRDASMPYAYAISYRPAVVYRWLPSSADEREAEPERFAPRAPRVAADAGADATPAEARDASPTTPAASDAGADTGVRIEDLEGAAGSPVLRRMLHGMYVSLDRALRGDTGTFQHTQSGGFVRAGALTPVRNFPTFQGVTLDALHRLPVGFAISEATRTYQPNGRGGFAPVGRVPRLSALWLSEEPPVPSAGDQYYHTQEGFFVRSRQVRVLTAHSAPADLAPGEKWIDVNLDHQSLVAYEGPTPVYATVASTGRRNRQVPEENYETIQGGFRILEKHVATTMDGNSANDGPYSIEDVPWVMYFEGSFALHGAFWHSGFGLMHSHGCVNLAPADAHWVFDWSEPRVPPGWHGVFHNPTRPGTRVYVHYDHQVLGESGGPREVPRH